MEDCHQWALSGSWDDQGQCYHSGRGTRQALFEGEIGDSRLSLEPRAGKLRLFETVALCCERSLFQCLGAFLKPR